MVVEAIKFSRKWINGPISGLILSPNLANVTSDVDLRRSVVEHRSQGCFFHKFETIPYSSNHGLFYIKSGLTAMTPNVGVKHCLLCINKAFSTSIGTSLSPITDMLPADCHYRPDH